MWLTSIALARRGQLAHQFVNLIVEHTLAWPTAEPVDHLFDDALEPGTQLGVLQHRLECLLHSSADGTECFKNIRRRSDVDGLRSRLRPRDSRQGGHLGEVLSGY